MDKRTYDSPFEDTPPRIPQERIDEAKKFFIQNLEADEQPKNADEFAETMAYGEIEDLAKRLVDLKNQAHGDVNNLNDSGREKSRQWAIVFLKKYQKDPYFIEDYKETIKTKEGKDYIDNLFRQAKIFAINAIDQTQYLNGLGFSSEGLEEFLPQRGRRVA